MQRSGQRSLLSGVYIQLSALMYAHKKAGHRTSAEKEMLISVPAVSK